jgi:hypothetical protein
MFIRSFLDKSFFLRQRIQFGNLFLALTCTSVFSTTQTKPSPDNHRNGWPRPAICTKVFRPKMGWSPNIKTRHTATRHRFPFQNGSGDTHFPFVIAKPAHCPFPLAAVSAKKWRHALSAI